MPFRLTTWNINSVRLRMPLVEQFVRDQAPDVLCLQETKCTEDQFPAKAFKALGYDHIAINGQKAYHGVATVSKIPFEDIATTEYCEKGDARQLTVLLKPSDSEAPFAIHNFYVPAGGDVPDPNVNEKFEHKLQFLEEMKVWSGARSTKDRINILVGDLNIAPSPDDVWSHKQLLKVVSHTPIETESLTELMTGGGWADCVRTAIPEPEKLFTWWSYRARDWDVSDRGRRLDHVWIDGACLDRVSNVHVLRDARGWEKPSDHVPVTVTVS